MNEITLSAKSKYLKKQDFNNDSEIFVFNNLLHPISKNGLFVDVFDSFMPSILGYRPVPIFENTAHEKIFSIIHPKLKKQVVFGTGKGGFKKWGVKKYTLDFFDEEKNIAYEIDGESHLSETAKLKDEYRDKLLKYLYGTITVRITNETVERQLLSLIRKVGVDKFYKGD